MSMFKRIVAAIAAVSVMGLSGCASIAGGSQSIGNAVGVKDRTTASAIGGGIVGCGLGAIAGVLHHGVLGAVAGCAVGGIAAGTLSAVASEKTQLDEQRANQLVYQSQLNSMNSRMQVVVTTKNVAEKDASGQPTSKETEAWNHTIVPMPPGRTDAVATLLGKAADLSDKSKKPVVIDVFVPTTADQVWYRNVLNSALPNGTIVRFTMHKGNPARLVISPMPVPAAA